MLKDAIKTNQLENDQAPPVDADAYFSADVETDGPIPGPFSLLSFALVYAGYFNVALRTTVVERSSRTYPESTPPVSHFLESDEPLRKYSVDARLERRKLRTIYCERFKIR